MKILVVGGAGYIGSVCTELLVDEGHEVAVFDNLTEGHRRALDSRAQFIEGDLADRSGFEAALAGIRPDAVMHFAASALVGESMENPSKYFRNNVANGLNLLDAMVSTGTERLVFSSTCAIFGPPERVPIDEDLPKRPIRSMA
jgi:UDP-glucose 4-epimerase